MSASVRMPGYEIYEYRLVIPVSEDLQEKISSLRKQLHDRYKVKLPFELKPCLTVLQCHAFASNEPRLVERFQDVAMGNHPFKVELKDFSAYPSHTIYIDVLTKSPFVELAKQFKHFKWMMNIPQHDPHYITEPHLIIAQRLKPMAFINMWMECEHSEFTGRFMADAMVLFRRKKEGDPYELVRRFQFMSLPQNVRQGVLFNCF